LVVLRVKLIRRSATGEAKKRQKRGKKEAEKKREVLEKEKKEVMKIFVPIIFSSREGRITNRSYSSCNRNNSIIYYFIFIRLLFQVKT
jgi:hypothetical protein